MMRNVNLNGGVEGNADAASNFPDTQVQNEVQQVMHSQGDVQGVVNAPG